MTEHIPAFYLNAQHEKEGLRGWEGLARKVMLGGDEGENKT